MAYSEDHIALAAEYALGTLDADERAQVGATMAADKEFTAIVQAWEFRLGVLNQMVGSVEPRPIVWRTFATPSDMPNRKRRCCCRRRLHRLLLRPRRERPRRRCQRTIPPRTIPT